MHAPRTQSRGNASSTTHDDARKHRVQDACSQRQRPKPERTHRPDPPHHNDITPAARTRSAASMHPHNTTHRHAPVRVRRTPSTRPRHHPLPTLTTTATDTARTTMPTTRHPATHAKEHHDDTDEEHQPDPTPPHPAHHRSLPMHTDPHLHPHGHHPPEADPPRHLRALHEDPRCTNPVTTRRHPSRTDATTPPPTRTHPLRARLPPHQLSGPAHRITSDRPEAQRSHPRVHHVNC